MRRLLKLSIIWTKSSYPQDFVNKQIKFFLENKINQKRVTINATNNVVRYYKLPYIGHISTDVKRKINRFCTFYRKSVSIKFV